VLASLLHAEPIICGPELSVVLPSTSIHVMSRREPVTLVSVSKRHRWVGSQFSYTIALVACMLFGMNSSECVNAPHGTTSVFGCVHRVLPLLTPPLWQLRNVVSGRCARGGGAHGSAFCCQCTRSRRVRGRDTY
jgi:hypothetical protein